MSRHPKLQPDSLYYIHNSAVPNNLLFGKEEDYLRFIARIPLHISRVAETLAWTLIPDRFDLIIKTHSHKTLSTEFERQKFMKCFNQLILPDFIMERFANLLNSHTKWINYWCQRKGPLFLDYTNRELIRDNDALLLKIRQVHRLPQTKGLVNDFSDWEYSSYKQFMDKCKRSKPQSKIIKLFEAPTFFTQYHHQVSALQQH